jgi:hypothetical protein
MSGDRFTLIDGAGPESHAGRTRPVETAARIDGERVLLPAASVREAFGFELKPEGLCRGELCVPVRDRAALVDGDAIDLAALARVLGRPLACDVAERTAVLGVSADERARRLASLEAPDFTLPDLTGKQHSLSQHRGKKVLLIAYASW